MDDTELRCLEAQLGEHSGVQRGALLDALRSNGLRRKPCGSSRAGSMPSLDAVTMDRRECSPGAGKRA